MKFSGLEYFLWDISHKASAFQSTKHIGDLSADSQSPLCAALDFTVFRQKGFRICGLELWSFLISIKIQGENSPYIPFIVVGDFH